VASDESESENEIEIEIERERHPDWMMIGVHWKLLCLSGQDRDTLRALL
jgi:hypothetical protein